MHGYSCSVLHIIMEPVLNCVWIYLFSNAGCAVLLQRALPVGCTLSSGALDDTELGII